MQNDRYVYPGTNVLKNRFNISDAALLNRVERQLSGYAVSVLRSYGVTGNFTPAHLQSIHRSLFSDIYDWAGQFRDIQLYKGGTAFCVPDEIESSLITLHRNISRAEFYKDDSLDVLADGLAHTMAELNRIHPFREGNGRTQRIFIEQLALNAGYDLDLSGISESTMRSDSMSAVRGDIRGFRYDIRNNLQKVDDSCLNSRSLFGSPLFDISDSFNIEDYEF